MYFVYAVIAHLQDIPACSECMATMYRVCTGPSWPIMSTRQGCSACQAHGIAEQIKTEEALTSLSGEHFRIFDHRHIGPFIEGGMREKIHCLNKRMLLKPS